MGELRRRLRVSTRESTGLIPALLAVEYNTLNHQQSAILLTNFLIADLIPLFRF